jgi:hypothetical protein
VVSSPPAKFKGREVESRQTNGWYFYFLVSLPPSRSGSRYFFRSQSYDFYSYNASVLRKERFYIREKQFFTLKTRHAISCTCLLGILVGWRVTAVESRFRRKPPWKQRWDVIIFSKYFLQNKPGKNGNFDLKYWARQQIRKCFGTNKKLTVHPKRRDFFADRWTLHWKPMPITSSLHRVIDSAVAPHINIPILPPNHVKKVTQPQHEIKTRICRWKGCNQLQLPSCGKFKICTY